MSPSPFAAALEAVHKPIAFAAQDNFAHADRVRGLEAAVRQAAERALHLRIPRDARRALEAVRERFAEPLSREALRSEAPKALSLLAPLRAVGFGAGALARPLTALPGVGPKRAEALARRGLHTISDLLLYLPTRYDDRRSLQSVADLPVGQRATFVATVLLCDFVPARRRGGRLARVFQAVVGDGTGTIGLKWFHGGEGIRSMVRKGTTLQVTGEVTRYRFSKQLVHPEIEVLEEEEGMASGDPAAAATRRVVPDYAAPEGLHPRALRRLVSLAVEEYADLSEGYLPLRMVRERQLPDVAQALGAIHLPGLEADVGALTLRRTAAHERLILEELYLLEIGLALRHAAQAAEPGMPFGAAGAKAPLLDAAISALPFRLTSAQRRVWREVCGDLARPHPMNRLLQGDVGSGKTAIALLAALAAARSGFQTALMAPTELLAEQHERTLQRLQGPAKGPLALRMALLTASVSRPEADARRRGVAAGEVELVIGTHSLLQENLEFARLGLAIIDEQHRFGVLQRAALAQHGAKGASPHVLVMTATPIPRTLALTLYGDLDLSVLDELPPGRVPVRTEILREGEGTRIAEAIRGAAARGEQSYVVYPLVEESEKSDLRAATESARKIGAAFPDLRIDLIHGRMEAAARAEAMARFERGETQVLVSTTVIEVGVDVPNATLIVVEHAERFGLAQLHQLRGRVGRGARPGRCILMARAVSEESEARLRAMAETSDGFAIADADLRIRGPGEFLGTRQHGRLPDLRVADLLRDARLIAAARESALETVRHDPGLRRAPELARAVRERWGERLALAGVG
ncbi:MAG TPA: ATP-dependent DNA helicase RecG [Myxococcota bacterium]|nr:ATP-dependent DNA helicase RecG [Myxococcota bacterium]